MLRAFSCSVHTSRVLLHDAGVKLTFFSQSPNCGLCDQTKEVIDDVFERKEFHNKAVSLEIVNITDRRNIKW
ncbi:CMF_HP2_G0012190.mRNA.1.CDS.1 [Saccharomyces cerevisiae]|nr:CMF_HP2_G0012190.mRNA.1.CDS.1 [Saccharomyces cerevisiae]CAI6443399.1 CMF_HP2_G0012190.mRNA.1.CDS.1 [Saccharomyces cerevisiae]